MNSERDKGDVMKRFKATAFVTILTVCVCMLCACAKGKSTLLSGASDADALNYNEYGSEEFATISEALDAFQAKFGQSAFEKLNEGENLVISPVSVFMALSLAADSAANESRDEILKALNIDYGSLSETFGYLYRSLLRTYDSGKIAVGNSVWLQDGTPVKESGLNSLSDKMFADVYSADFNGDNRSANLAVRNFVKEKTEGMIDVDFELSPETLFVLINTLYLSDSWNAAGRKLQTTAEEYSFKNADGGTSETKLLQGNYTTGRVYDGGDFYTYYSATEAGFRLKFLLPKDGRGIADVFTAENLTKVNAVTDYGGIDEDRKIQHMTRVLFPSFEAEFNKDILSVLHEDFGINGIFDPLNADFTTLLEAPKGSNFIYKLQHVAKLKVDAEGIEGAAATVVAGKDTSSDPVYTKQYHDFVIDSAFGFVLTDVYGNVLFSGVINAV